jgi:hypothetical protein
MNEFDRKENVKLGSENDKNFFAFVLILKENR